MSRIAFSWIAIFTLAGAFAQAQDPPPPAPVKGPPSASPALNAAAVKALGDGYRAEKKELIDKGFAKRFLPALMEKADELAQRADKALADKRWTQASELYRQARWQLPYQSPQVPAEHVARVLGNLRMRHDAAVNAIAYSPDGKLLASAGADNLVRIWDLANGHEVRTLAGHDAEVNAVVFSPDGKTLASGGAEPKIRLWNVADGKELRTFAGDGIGEITALVYSPDGKYLIAGQSLKAGAVPPQAFSGPAPPPAAKGFQLGVYDPHTGKQVRKVGGFHDPVYSLVFHPSGTVLAVGSGGTGDDNVTGKLSLWEYAPLVQDKSNPVEYWSQELTGKAVNRLTFSPNGKTLAVAAGGGVSLYNYRQPKDGFDITSPRIVVALPVVRLNYRVKNYAALFSPDGKTLYVGGSDGTIYTYDPETGFARDTLKGHSDRVFVMCFSPSGMQFASAGADHTIRLWDSEVVMQARDFAGHDGAVWKTKFSPDGRYLVSASADHTVRIWDVETGKVKHTLTGHRSAVTAVLFSPDGKFIASAGGDRLIKIWDADSGKHLRDLTGHQATITALDFAPEGGGAGNGKRLVSAGSDHQLIVWDYETGKQLLTLDNGPTIAAAVAYSPNGKQIAAGNIDTTVRLFDAVSGKQETSWSAHGGALGGLAYSPDGRLLASCGVDGVVRVWHTETPGLLPILLFGHTGPVSAVAFHKDNVHLASCGGDTSIKLWRLDGGSGKEIQAFRGHKDWLTSVAFSKDGFYLASSGADRVIKLWEMTTREIPLVSEHGDAVQSVAVSLDGKYIASGSSDTTIKIWERATGVEVATLRGHTRGVFSLAFSNDGKQLVSGGFITPSVPDDRFLRLWDLATSTEVLPQKAQQQNWSNFNSYPALLAVAPGSNNLLVWEPGFVSRINGNRAVLVTKISVFDIATGVEQFSFTDNDRQSHAISIAADCKSVAVAGAGPGGSLRLYDLDKRGQMKPGGDWFLFDEKTSTGDIALSPDGSYLAAGTSKGELKICKVASRDVERTIQAHAGYIRCCQISPDGKRVVTFGQDNILKLWDLKTGEKLRQWNMFAAPPGDAKAENISAVQNLVFTPDSKQIVSANSNTTLYVLDLP